MTDWALPGSDYADLIAYSKSLRSAPGTGPDLLDQLGTFSAARHYGFVRVLREDR